MRLHHGLRWHLSHLLRVSWHSTCHWLGHTLWHLTHRLGHGLRHSSHLWFRRVLTRVSSLLSSSSHLALSSHLVLKSRSNEGEELVEESIDLRFVEEVYGVSKVLFLEVLEISLIMELFVLSFSDFLDFVMVNVQLFTIEGSLVKFILCL